MKLGLFIWYENKQHKLIIFTRQAFFIEPSENSWTGSEFVILHKTIQTIWIRQLETIKYYYNENYIKVENLLNVQVFTMSIILKEKFIYKTNSIMYLLLLNTNALHIYLITSRIERIPNGSSRSPTFKQQSGQPSLSGEYDPGEPIDHLICLQVIPPNVISVADPEVIGQEFGDQK